jgi:hypothetical protein
MDEDIQLVVLLVYYVCYLIYIFLIKFKFIDFIDIASGSTVDWAYDVLKIKHSYTIELPPTQSKYCFFFALR